MGADSDYGPCKRATDPMRFSWFPYRQGPCHLILNSTRLMIVTGGFALSFAFFAAGSFVSELLAFAGGLGAKQPPACHSVSSISTGLLRIF